MANKTIKNDSIITINRTITNEDLTTTIKPVNVGRYYLEASRELKSATFQLFFDEILTDKEEMAQVNTICKTEVLSFIGDCSLYGWGDLFKII
jgi:hypothetical protein